MRYRLAGSLHLLADWLLLLETSQTSLNQGHTNASCLQS
jgi:hypothetical protein